MNLTEPITRRPRHLTVSWYARVIILIHTGQHRSLDRNRSPASSSIATTIKTTRLVIVVQACPPAIIWRNLFQGYDDQTVVVIGIGNSGADIAVELSKICKKVRFWKVRFLEIDFDSDHIKPIIVWYSKYRCIWRHDQDPGLWIAFGTAGSQPTSPI